MVDLIKCQPDLLQMLILRDLTGSITMLLLKRIEEMVLSVQRLSQYRTSARIFKTRQMLCHPCQMAHNLPPLPHAVLFLPHSNHWRQRLFLWIQRCSGKKEKGKASGACILLKLILQKAWWPTTPKLKLHQGHCFLYNYKGYVWENLRNFTAFHKKCLVIST